MPSLSFAKTKKGVLVEERETPKSASRRRGARLQPLKLCQNELVTLEKNKARNLRPSPSLVLTGDPLCPFLLHWLDCELGTNTRPRFLQIRTYPSQRTSATIWTECKLKVPAAHSAEIGPFVRVI